MILGRAAAATVLVTWDSGNIGSSVALSNGNLTWTSSNAGNVSGRATTGYLAGTGITRASYLKYYEVTIVTPGSSTVGVEIGIMNASEVFTNLLGGTGNSVSLDVPSGDVFTQSTVFATYTAQIGTGGTVYGVAIDFLHQKVWWTINGTSWNNDILANQNPATNTGGFASGLNFVFQPGGTFSTVYPGFGSRSSGPAATANFGATSFVFPVPSGYSAWNQP